MAITILSSSYIGVNSYIVEVEADISNGLPNFCIVGMGDTAILESKERIRSSLKNMGISFPVKRVIVNLSPADIKKRGSQFDLSICVGILANMGYISNLGKLSDYLILGELALSGDIKSCKGIINAAVLAKEHNLKGIIVPFDNAREAQLINGLDIISVKNLADVLRFFNEDKKIKLENFSLEEYYSDYDIDFSEVKGQFFAKRAFEISAAGGHNIFLIGDPGSGKSMLAKRLISILPSMSEKEIIETTRIYSISGFLSKDSPIINKRPFRSPHHTATIVSMVGGSIRPGEVSLALNGVLFLDELGEYPVKLLEVLRQPLEDGKITISRSDFTADYPVNMILVTATNPTPGGFFEDDPRCTDSLTSIKKYKKKFSGPLLDRMDIYVEMRRLSKEEILDNKISESSEKIRQRVINARKVQFQRHKNEKLNKDMNKNDLAKFCKLDSKTEDFLDSAIENFNLSARSYDKVLKVSRTIADLDGKENIFLNHVLEALNYRRR